jgi:hypothetical protein
LRTFGEPRRNFVPFGVELAIIDSKADETDSLGVGAKQRITKQQVTFGPRHPTQPPRDYSDKVAGGNAKSRVAIRSGIETKPAPAQRVAQTTGLEQLMM